MAGNVLYSLCAAMLAGRKSADHRVGASTVHKAWKDVVVQARWSVAWVHVSSDSSRVTQLHVNLADQSTVKS